jgi:hypothetical protein
MDRDARLAYAVRQLFVAALAQDIFRNSRPPSMLPLVQADDESMSDGDESDDVDLTDGSSYISDMSEWNEGIVFNGVIDGSLT